MIISEKVRPQHVQRKAILYIRQSSPYQVTHNLESQKLQYAMRERLRQLGWHEIEVVDGDLAPSARSNPTAFQAVSFEPPIPYENGKQWRNIDIARTRSSI